jgi:allantoin racemase
MELRVITPVKLDTAGEMEEGIALYSERFLRPDTRLSFVSLSNGCACIESEAHALTNGPETLALARQAERDGVDGVFINCFDDPAVFACRECMRIPIFGAYAPAVLTALGLAERIGIITTDVPGILSEERKARQWGISERIGAIRCVDMGVAGLLARKDDLVATLTKTCLDIHEKDRIHAVCLGCTGMAYAVDDLFGRLKEMGCPICVVEPVQAALTWLERTVVMGHSNSLGLSIEI